MSILRLVLSGFAVFTLMVLHAPAFAAFSDVPSFHPNAKAIAYVQAEGIVEGYADGTFRPDQRINRAEFTKILIESYYDNAGPGAENCLQDVAYIFPDVHSSLWYAKYICTAKNVGFIDGYPDGTFRAANSINFVEAAKILSTAYNTLNTFCSGPSPLAGPDGCPIEGRPWYEWYVRSLDHRNAIPFSISSFDHLITRGEMAEMIYRLNKGVPWQGQTYEQLSWNADPFTTYQNAQLGIKFSYPSAWSEPELDSAQLGFDWVIRFGPVCEGCAEGTDAHLMDIVGVSRQKVLADIERIRVQNNGLISEVSDVTQNGLRIFTWNEGGICGSRTAYVISANQAVRVGGFCLGDSPSNSLLLDNVAATVRFSGTSTSNDIAFDGCGAVKGYADRSWFQDFVRVTDSVEIPLDGYSEGCLSTDGTLFLAIWDGGFCARSRVLQYDIQQKRMTAATIWHGNPPGCYNIRTFGLRTGSIIPLKGFFKNEQCSAEYHYEYNLLENAATLTKTDWRCQ